MSFRNGIKQWGRALSNFLYPPFCLHCSFPLDEGMNLFCKVCFQQIEMIASAERCRFCFSPDETGERICPNCRENLPLWNGAASAVDYQGPAISLISAIKYGNQPYLAKGAAALMVQQFAALDWPAPDLIVPVPIPLTRWLERGYNQSALLAEEIGRMLDRPVVNALKRKSGDFSQAGLSSKQRKELTPYSFSCVKPEAVQDQIVLLVDDVITTGATLKCCAESLLEGYPRSIYVMTFSRA